METENNPDNNEAQANPNAAVLTKAQFTNLYLSIQLLRISQLRYIVQKYSLPASGNKSKLVQRVLSIIDSMRFTPFLKPIYEEVLQLVSSQHKPFVNPLTESAKIVPKSPQGTLLYYEHPLIKRPENSIILGPLFCQRNFSSGTFTFNISYPIDKIFIFFGADGALPSPFTMTAQINGVSIYVFQDDPEPSPINITDFIIEIGKPNTLMIQSVVATDPIYITIEHAHQIFVKDLAKKLPGKGAECKHEEKFDTEEFISKAIATNIWNCPICSTQIAPESVLA